MSSEHAGDGTVASENFDEIRDVTVIGAGPVGLIAAFWAGMREATARLVDSLPDIGGQVTTLYPEKWIFDVPGHARVLGKDLIAELRRQSIDQFDVPVHLETTALRLEYEPDPDDVEREIIRLETDRGDLLSRALVIAGGHGAFEPKKLPGISLDEWQGKGLHYLVHDKSEFEGKDVAVVGGGDSACDWALSLLDTARSVAIVHRREQFRAHEGTTREMIEAQDAGRMRVLTPYQLKAVEGEESIERITVFDSADEEKEETIPCDALLLQLGFKTSLGPLADWGLEVEKNAIVVDRLMRTNLRGVWACGDIATFEGKLKLIATGFSEAAIAVTQAVLHVHPEMRLQPQYSSNVGVPGAAEGQP